MNAQTPTNTSVPDGSANPLRHQWTLAIDIQELKKKREAYLRHIARTVRIPGFRPGKAPLRLLEQDYGQEADQETLIELSELALQQEATARNLQVATAISMTATTSDDPAKLKFLATIEVYPHVELADLSQISIERPILEITAADIDEELQEMRLEQGDDKTVTRGAESGDFVTISYDGTLNGAPLPENETFTDYEITLGETDAAWQAFDAEIVGMKAGEVKNFEFTYPDDHETKALAGKKAQIHLTVSEVKTWTPAELDHDFFTRYEIDDGDLDKLHAMIRKTLEQKAEKLVYGLTKRRVFDAVLAAHPFPVPEELVKEKARQLQQEDRDKMQSFVNMMGSLKDAPSDASNEAQAAWFHEKAQRDVRLNLVFDEINNIHEFRVTPEQIQARIKELYRVYHQAYDTDHIRDSAAVYLMEKQIVDWLLDKINVVDVPYSYEALSKMRADLLTSPVPIISPMPI
ncbi:trigger factor [Betaproteobacteria bacterium]|nr:trigger factor [Betaproteobacteria bacterium]GHU40324.1 trigger factor [Betaproteobacteria bacterium]